MLLDHCHLGDCRTILPTLTPKSVQCVVTSPPYWGLRDYGVAGQLGLESTPEEYVANMVEVFRLVREVLADDGTLWLNLGDCYATGAGAVGQCPGGGEQGERWKGNRGTHNAENSGKHGPSLQAMGPRTQPNRMPIAGLKPKDLVGIPWRVAFALQADGWYLRSDIIWHKPNPMPESVTDRPTKSHEYLFLLSKSERYYYDAEAISEPSSQDSIDRYERGRSETHKWADGGPGNQTIAKSFEHMRMPKDEGRIADGLRPAERFGGGPGWRDNPDARLPTRNRRTVWTIATQPFSGAHFATFPEALVEPCILSGSRVGDIVLDPFMGSGTVAQVAQNLGRRWLGCELSEAYLKLQARRTEQLGMAFA